MSHSERTSESPASRYPEFTDAYIQGKNLIEFRFFFDRWLSTCFNLCTIIRELGVECSQRPRPLIGVVSTNGDVAAGWSSEIAATGRDVGLATDDLPVCREGESKPVSSGGSGGRQCPARDAAMPGGRKRNVVQVAAHDDSGRISG